MTSHHFTSATVHPAASRRSASSHLSLVPDYVEPAAAQPDQPADPEARERLILDYLPLAHRLARRFYGRGEHQDDLNQVALLALVRAADGFDPCRSTPFPAYAIPSILGELRRYFRDYGWAIRVPRRLQELQAGIASTTDALTHSLGATPEPTQVAKSLGVACEDVRAGLLAATAYRATSLDAPSGTSTSTLGDSLAVREQSFDGVEARHVLAQVMPQLSAEERHILGLRFFHQLTQAEIARELGLTQMQVCRQLTRTLHSLRSLVEDSVSTLTVVQQGNEAS
ncbi:MAG: sigma-70 family RNA polymerase sigma factor [Angustibacter sp.]